MLANSPGGLRSPPWTLSRSGRGLAPALGSCRLALCAPRIFLTPWRRPPRRWSGGSMPTSTVTALSTSTPLSPRLWARVCQRSAPASEPFARTASTLSLSPTPRSLNAPSSAHSSSSSSRASIQRRQRRPFPCSRARRGHCCSSALTRGFWPLAAPPPRSSSSARPSPQPPLPSRPPPPRARPSQGPERGRERERGRGWAGGRAWGHGLPSPPHRC